MFSVIESRKKWSTGYCRACARWASGTPGDSQGTRERSLARFRFCTPAGARSNCRCSSRLAGLSRPCRTAYCNSRIAPMAHFGTRPSPEPVLSLSRVIAFRQDALPRRHATLERRPPGDRGTRERCDLRARAVPPASPSPAQRRLGATRTDVLDGPAGARFATDSGTDHIFLRRCPSKRIWTRLAIPASRERQLQRNRQCRTSLVCSGRQD